MSKQYLGNFSAKFGWRIFFPTAAFEFQQLTI